MKAVKPRKKTGNTPKRSAGRAAEPVPPAQPERIVGPVGDIPFRLASGQEVPFPIYWKGAEGFYLSGLVDAAKVEPYLEPYGLHVLRADTYGFPKALVGFGVLQYASGPPVGGPFREAFIGTFATRRRDHVLDAATFLSIFRTPFPPSTPPTSYGGYVLKSWIDADEDEAAERALVLYNEALGHQAERARIELGPEPHSARLSQGRNAIVELELPGRATGLVLGLTNQFNTDYPSISRTTWSRAATRGYVGESVLGFVDPATLATRYSFRPNDRSPWGFFLSKENFQPLSYWTLGVDYELHYPETRLSL